MTADSHGELGARLLQQARELQTSAMERRRDRSAQALPVYRQALEHFRAAATLAPGSSQTHRFCALVLSELGELDAACASFAQAYRLARTNADVAAEYASSLQSAGNTAAAVAIYEDALRQHPAHAGLPAGFALRSE